MPAPYSYETTEEFLNSSELGRQIIRIRENVSAALTAIGNKGVTVPSGSNSDDLADLIGSIQTSGGTPSATQHTILFEFSDNTNTTITAYWTSTFISDAVRATTPSTYDGKVVNTAFLDGVEWYNAVDYFVLYEGTPVFYTDSGNYFWIPELGNVVPTVGSVWRITIDGTKYDCIAQNREYLGVIVGNPVHVGGTDDGSGAPVAFYNYNNQAWSGDTTTFTEGNHTIKIEHQGTL